VIGVPFYLADPKLAELVRAVNDIEDEREILMYLRHEAGHAFNYAYELYKTKEWIELFGPFDRPYVETYAPIPFSRRFVRHVAGWYAQKHPDEDHAETFAVWLTPRSAWKKRYAGWPALKKLEYVDELMGEIAGRRPPVKATLVSNAHRRETWRYATDHPPANRQHCVCASCGCRRRLAAIYRAGATGAT